MNSLKERYVDVKRSIQKRESELERLYDTKRNLKQQLIVHELQTMPEHYKRMLESKLTRLKIYVDCARVDTAEYGFRYVEQTMDACSIPIHDPLNWEIAEYQLQGKTNDLEIVFDVSSAALVDFVYGWMTKNMPSFVYTEYLYYINLRNPQT